MSGSFMLWCIVQVVISNLCILVFIANDSKSVGTFECNCALKYQQKFSNSHTYRRSGVDFHTSENFVLIWVYVFPTLNSSSFSFVSNLPYCIHTFIERTFQVQNLLGRFDIKKGKKLTKSGIVSKKIKFNVFAVSFKFDFPSCVKPFLIFISRYLNSFK